jgi:MraZ protein
LRESGNTNGTGIQLVLRPSHFHSCIEAWPVGKFETLATPLEHYSPLSAEHEDLAASLYADAYPVEADKEGRILIPDQLAAHAGLTEAVVFMGMGTTFQIWEPAAADRRRAEARTRARDLAPPGTPGGTPSGTPQRAGTP